MGLEEGSVLGVVLLDGEDGLDEEKDYPDCPVMVEKDSGWVCHGLGLDERSRDSWLCR